MSLVDYASSDDDDEGVNEEEGDHQSEAPIDDSGPPPPPPQTQNSGSTPNQQPDSTLHSSMPSSLEKLPDASLLLNSPAISSSLASHSDHASRVAAAIAQSASRKRESNGLVSNFPLSKVPRGTLPHSRNVPDTEGGLLVPPQLRGRVLCRWAYLMNQLRVGGILKL
ncbi:uncharacterized protein LOC131163956 isoform X2 [Malania oleifera]|uniref:uncharacterized protein LOC131163956 isoform X2 n=1 Tax=Malania oleifera TaxID=397392 RepID=UPI0025AE6E93|nr:uncharacterized protein LOC131163956 isoform X2 [Malania oleifera]